MCFVVILNEGSNHKRSTVNKLEAAVTMITSNKDTFSKCSIYLGFIFIIFIRI